MGKKPLEGIKVLDFTWAIAGPEVTKVLANWGAEVIKIESKQQMRMMWDRTSAGVNLRNTSKRSLALNLAKPGGLDIAKRLVAWSDIVVENFAGGAIKRMGLGYEEVKKIKPDIIMLSSSALGQTGPGGSHPGHASPLGALTGFNYISGWPDREGEQLFGSYTDLVAPRYHVVAILAALDYRRRTGKGQYIDGSQYEAGIHFLAPLLLDYTVNQRVASRMGNRSSYAAPHGAYRCRGEDRWCAIAVYTDEEWQGFCKVIGNPAWTKEPRFSTLLARKENEDELDRLVEEWTINHSPEEVMSLMQETGVGAGVLQTGEDLLEHDPQLKHLHFFWELEQSGVGKQHVYGPPFLLSKSSYELRTAPLLGEDNEYVLKEILGMSDEEVAELIIEEVIE